MRSQLIVCCCSATRTIQVRAPLPPSPPLPLFLILSFYSPSFFPSSLTPHPIPQTSHLLLLPSVLDQCLLHLLLPPPLLLSFLPLLPLLPLSVLSLLPVVPPLSLLPLLLHVLPVFPELLLCSFIKMKFFYFVSQFICHSWHNVHRRRATGFKVKSS